MNRISKNSPAYLRNRQRQAYMKAAGYNVPQDGSWGPYQQSIWNKLVQKQTQNNLKKYVGIVNQKDNTRVNATFYPVIKKEDNGHVIYLHYPSYIGGVEGDSFFTKVLGNSKFPVGHNAVITVSPENKTKYYEYGRYSNDKNIIGESKRASGEKIFGNVRNFPIPDKFPFENDSNFIERIKDKLPYSNNDALVEIFPANVKLVNDGFIILANNKNRANYSLNPFKNGYVRTCATEANRLIKRGLNKEQLNILNKNAMINAVRSNPFSLWDKPVYADKDSVNTDAAIFEKFNPFASGRYFKYFSPIASKNFKIKAENK